MNHSLLRTVATLVSTARVYRALAGLIPIAVACVREPAAKIDSTHVNEQATITRTDSVVSTAPPSPVTESTASPVASSQSDTSPPLTCSPTTFTVGDTVALRMATPHGHYLWITRYGGPRPGGTPYVIVYPPEEKMKAGHSLVPSDEFVQMSTMRLPAGLQAFPYVYGRDTILESVFSEPGKYTLEVGDNFATDGGIPPASCTLTFFRRIPR